MLRWLKRKIEYRWRRLFNEPIRLRWTTKAEGEPVGPEIHVSHLAMHDMQQHMVDGAMTIEVLKHGLRANVIQLLDVQTEGMRGVATIQPRWIEGEAEEQAV